MKDKTTQEIQTIIGPSVSVEGDFKGDGDVLIEGKFSGSIKTKQDIRIGKDAKVKANIEADNIFVSGNVTGDLQVKNRLEMAKTATIKGNISCLTLGIEPGAKFNGQSVMDETTPSEQPKQPENKELT